MPASRALDEEQESQRLARRAEWAGAFAVALTVALVVGGVGVAVATTVGGGEIEHASTTLLWIALGLGLASGLAAVAVVRRRAVARIPERLQARPLEASDRARRQLVRRSQEMALAAGIEAPSIWLRPGPEPNVSAWCDRGGGHLAFTEGALALPQPELAVLAAHGCARLRLRSGRHAARIDGTAGALLGWSADEWGNHRELRGLRLVAVVAFFVAFSLLALLVQSLLRAAARDLRRIRRDRAQASDALAASFVRDPDSVTGFMARARDGVAHGAKDMELVAATSFVAPPGTLGARQHSYMDDRIADVRRGWSVA